MRLKAQPRTAVGVTIVAVIVVLLAATVLYDRSQAHEIAPGVHVGGVAVGGMSESKARSLLATRLHEAATAPVVVHAAGRSFTLTPAAAGVRVGDPAALAAKAVSASRQGNLFTRVTRDITGGSVRTNISVDVRYSRGAVERFVARVTRSIDRPARDAQVVPSLAGLHEQAEQTGRKVDPSALRTQVMSSLGALGGTRQVTASVTTIAPKVTQSQLASRYPAYIVINRGGFDLKFYKHLKLEHTYPIAVGMQGLETPAGLYDIQWKQVNPPWYVPNSSWAGSLAGKTIPPGPQDPLKARFMAFNGGAGIHGIDPSEYGTIGHNASHGCVRMMIPDVIQLYSEAPVHTPVYISG